MEEVSYLKLVKGTVYYLTFEDSIQGERAYLVCWESYSEYGCLPKDDSAWWETDPYKSKVRFIEITEDDSDMYYTKFSYHSFDSGQSHIYSITDDEIKIMKIK